MRINKQEWMSASNGNKAVLKKLSTNFDELIDMAANTIISFTGGFKVVHEDCVIGGHIDCIRFVKGELYIEKEDEDVLRRPIPALETLNEVWFEFCQSVGNDPSKVTSKHIMAHAEKYAQKVIEQMEAFYKDTILAVENESVEFEGQRYVVIRFILASLTVTKD